MKFRSQWDAIRASAYTLLYSCLEGDTAPGTGGQVVYNGSPGPSTEFMWPDNLH